MREPSDTALGAAVLFIGGASLAGCGNSGRPGAMLAGGIALCLVIAAHWLGTRGR